VGASTKNKILEYLAERDLSESDAHNVATSILMKSEVINQLLQAADAQMQIYACGVLVNLALNTSSAPVVLQLNPCGRLVSLLW
jgi:hypothetical protein